MGLPNGHSSASSVTGVGTGSASDFQPYYGRDKPCNNTGCCTYGSCAKCCPEKYIAFNPWGISSPAWDLKGPFNFYIQRKEGGCPKPPPPNPICDDPVYVACAGGGSIRTCNPRVAVRY